MLKPLKNADANNKLFTNQVTRSVLVNTKLSLLCTDLVKLGHTEKIGLKKLRISLYGTE